MSHYEIEALACNGFQTHATRIDICDVLRRALITQPPRMGS